MAKAKKKNNRVLPNELPLNIIEAEYSDLMEKSYIDYSMSVITARAIPDVRDGLKPVQRRILHDMDELGVSSDKPYRKSARIVGDTMGKYHPHGDCLDAETKIMLANGEIKTIKELYEEGTEQTVVCFDTIEGKMTCGVAYDFRIGQYTNTIYEIVLQNGYSIKVTGNHPFLLSNGAWIKAEEMKSGMLLSFTDAERSSYKVWQAFKRMNGDIFRVNASTFDTQFYPERPELPSFRPLIVKEIESKKYKEIPAFQDIMDKYPNFKGGLFNEHKYQEYLSHCFAIVKDVIVTTTEEEIPMYDFTVDDYHNMYIVANEDATLQVVAHNSSIYEAMVVMAQDFKKGQPLVDGHGNFGSFEGDGPAAPRYCVTGETLIPTNMGLRRIDSIVPDIPPNSDYETEFLVKSQGGTINKANCIFNSGKHNVSTITLQNGLHIRGTDNHPLLCLSETGIPVWKTMDTIQIGDECILDADCTNRLFGNNDDLDEAGMLGTMLATGYRFLDKAYGVQASEAELLFPVQRYFQTHYEQADAEHFAINKTPVGNSGMCYQCIIDYKDACKQLFREYNLKRDRTDEIPIAVFNGTEAYLKTFLQYFFSLNSCVDITGNNLLVTCYSESKKVIDQLQIILLSYFGIESSYNLTKQMFADMHKLVIAGASANKFCTEIGYLDTYKSYRLTQFSQNQTLTIDARPKRRISKVVSKHVSKKKEIVYSIRVDSECHSFSGNGFINHNTEARLQPFTEDVFLKDIKNGTVDFQPNYDETEKEPSVLPCHLPNLLINGSEGIAVGMTTSIPPHNITEVIDTAISYANNPKQSVEELLATLKGPDFPTGGIVANASDLPEIYSSGQGKIRVRGKIEVEKSENGRLALVISEIPYTMLGSGMAKFLSDVAGLVEDHVLPEITDILNQSSKEGIRIVLELKRGVKEDDLERIQNILYKKTRLEDTFGVSMLAINAGVPAVMNLKDIMQSFYQFQEELLTRKAQHLLEKEKKKKEINEGLVHAVECIDTIIEVLRGSQNVKMARSCLEHGTIEGIAFKTKKAEKEASKFCFTELQATAILEMKLSRLIRLELNAIIKEMQETEKRILYYESIINDKNGKIKKKEIIKELNVLKEKYPQKRKTKIDDVAAPVIIEKEEEEYPIVLLMDRFMYIHSIDVQTYEKNKETVESEYRTIIHTMSRSKLVLFTDTGKMHTLKMSDIPSGRLRDKGQPIDNLCGYDSKTESIVGMYTLDGKEERELLFVLNSGYVKRVSLCEFDVTRKTIDATKLPTDNTVISVLEFSESGQLILHSHDGFFIRITQGEIPVQKKTAVGVKGMTLKEGDFIDTVIPLTAPSAHFIWGDKEYEGTKIKLQKRGGKGSKTTL